MSDGRECLSFLYILISEPTCRSWSAVVLTVPVNDARAMRVSEVVTDFRSSTHQISALATDPPPQESTLVGWLVLNQCKAEIRLLLARPFDSGPSLQVPGGNPEHIKVQLQR